MPSGAANDVTSELRVILLLGYISAKSQERQITCVLRKVFEKS